MTRLLLVGYLMLLGVGLTAAQICNVKTGTYDAATNTAINVSVFDDTAMTGFYDLSVSAESPSINGTEIHYNMTTDNPESGGVTYSLDYALYDADNCSALSEIASGNIFLTDTSYNQILLAPPAYNCTTVFATFLVLQASALIPVGVIYLNTTDSTVADDALACIPISTCCPPPPPPPSPSPPPSSSPSPSPSVIASPSPGTSPLPPPTASPTPSTNGTLSPSPTPTAAPTFTPTGPPLPSPGVSIEESSLWIPLSIFGSLLVVATIVYFCFGLIRRRRRRRGARRL